MSIFLGPHAFNNVTPRSLVNLERDREYHACGCLHVRTATLLLGLLQIIVHLLVIMSTVILFLNPAGLQTSSTQYHVMNAALHMFPFSTSHAASSNNPFSNSFQMNTFVGDNQSLRLKSKQNVSTMTTENPLRKFKSLQPSVSTKSDLFYSVFSFPSPKSRPPPFEHKQSTKRGEQLWSLLLTFLSLFFTLVLIHGVLYRKATHLLPYFCVQVFDFVLACLTIMSYMTYVPEWKTRSDDSFMITSTDGEESLDTSNNSGPVYWHRLDSSTRLAFMSLAFLLLAFKFYLMGMVWSCYKYLILWQRLNSTVGNGEPPTTLRTAIHDMWNHMRQPVGRNGVIWIPLGSRLAGACGANATTNIRDTLSQLNEEEGIGDHSAINAIEERPPLEPPKYEDVLKQPANSNMPPPYFKESTVPSSENAGASGSSTT